MWYDAILELAHAIWKNGLSLGTVGTLIYVALKQRKIRSSLKRYFPFLFSDEKEVREYVANQHLIMENQRRMMTAMGVEPACPENAVISRTSSGSTRARKAFFLLSWAESLHVRAAVARGMSSTTISNQWRKIHMKKWIKPDSLTAFGAVIIAAVNRYFGFEIDPANLIAAAVLLIGYFKSQELVTVVRDANGLPSGFRLNSRKLIFTAVAFLCVVLDELFKLGLSTEILLAVAAGVTGANYLEANKDVKQAEAEGADARNLY
jgi:hypothetical protein